eukprot:TRINITY_DN10421_c0_g1_i1.p1 TRINITY_DN10421_c0_g1~~TRINITY_DN10421_c0_g1_i1.p1  ORF type:complete len:546 (+),score=64.94 TRINITY_DN10421_c0_g1_i1:43-1680(+)
MFTQSLSRALFPSRRVKIERHKRSYSVYLTQTYPSIQLPVPWGLPIEVVLIGQIGHGGGSALVDQVKRRQQRHPKYVDALDEPSAQIANTTLQSDDERRSGVRSVEDKTAVYTFSVDKSHPFHRHAGHRVFTACTGSSGAYLRFSTSTLEEIEQDPDIFLQKLSQVHIPGDCLFTIRFDGTVWHQFSAVKDSNPAFFAISVHTDETGGQLSADLVKQIRSNQASIPALTQVLPQQVEKRIKEGGAMASIATYKLSLEPPIRTIICDTVRSTMGPFRTWMRQFLSAIRSNDGHVAFPFLKQSKPLPTIASVPLDAASLADAKDLFIYPPIKQNLNEGSILQRHFPRSFHFEDSYLVRIMAKDDGNKRTIRVPLDPHIKEALLSRKCDSAGLMERLLAAFLDHPPQEVTAMMQLRNVLVTPLRLRTSPLACPISSLGDGSGRSKHYFGIERRFPVRDQLRDGDSTQVTLGANDKHLQFRSVVALDTHRNQDNNISAIDVRLSTRVFCLNAFGKFYMRSIESAHEHHIIPSLMQNACKFAFQDRTLHK